MSATPALASPPDVPADEVVQASSIEDAAAQQAASELPAAEQSTLSQAQTERTIARLRSAALPPALQERLIAVVQAGGEPSPPLEQVLAAVEELLPEFLLGSGRQPQRPEHPAGEAFFRGGDEMSEAQAEQLAREQLQRSGLLRGQRVRVAD
jgi:hypothetical protein